MDEPYIDDTQSQPRAMSVVANLARATVEARWKARGFPPPALGEYVDRFDVRAELISQLSAESRADLASIAAVSALKLISERATVARDRERVYRFQDELIRIVGDDLRAPLGTIEVGIEMLANASDSAVGIARISSFTKRLSRIVDHVVDLTRARLAFHVVLPGATVTP